MKSRAKFVHLCVLICLGFLAWPATGLAGGVVVTLDTLPENVVANEPVMIGFTLRRHGETLSSDLEPVVTATNVETGETLEFIAKHDDKPGHYVVALTLPSVGEWTWGIRGESYLPEAQMPQLSVLAQSVEAASAPAVQEAFPAWRWLAIASGLAAVVAFIVAGVVTFRATPIPAPEAQPVGCNAPAQCSSDKVSHFGDNSACAGRDFLGDVSTKLGQRLRIVAAAGTGISTLHRQRMRDLSLPRGSQRAWLLI